jgi:voltage-gated potassium channel
MDAKAGALEQGLGKLTYLNNLLLIPMFTVMVLETMAGVGQEELILFRKANLWFCGFFMAEWVLGLAVTTNRKEYLTSVEKWLDCLSSVPFGVLFQGLRVARLIRILRVVRLILRARRFKGKGAKLLRVFGVVAATVFAGGLGLRIVEPETVRGLGDALWWSVITVSTVGYGDIAPATSLGRGVATVLVFIGIGVFGYVAGFMTSLMEDPEEDEILSAVKRIEERLSRGHERF